MSILSVPNDSLISERDQWPFRLPSLGRDRETILVTAALCVAAIGGISFLASTINVALAQVVADQVTANPAQGDNIRGAINPLENLQFVLTIVAFVFGLIVILSQFFVLRRVQPLAADDIAKNCAITTVVTAALVLIIAGYNSSQIAPAFGLFGTIVGYLLGRSSRRSDSLDMDRQRSTPQTAPTTNLGSPRGEQSDDD